MDMLTCKTPAMAVKEIWTYLLAYNLIRRLVAHVQPRQLSFKHAVQLWLAWHHRQLRADDHGRHTVLLALIAQKRVGNRPGRIEPRAIKRRPKPFPLLLHPRPIARERVVSTWCFGAK